MNGDALNTMSDNAHGGDDILTGGNNYANGIVQNGIRGDADQMTDSVKGGDDHLTGGNNFGAGSVSNTLYGDATFMSGDAHGGNDVLTGGDNYQGGSLLNRLRGDAFQMSDSAHGGNDSLIAGTASAGSTVTNLLWGDAVNMLGAASGGQDTFIFKDNVAVGQTVGINNFVEDFSQSQHDLIEFSSVAGVTSFASLTFDTTIQPGSTIIHAGADQVTLLGFTGTLTAHDFLFA
jgi:hypothetical protein